jgi:drug/metabolite transporter (DMT)-like permease
MSDVDRALRRAMPWVFVLIWSTGFIVARFGMPYAPPLRFLVIRYMLSALCFGAWIAMSRAVWPRERAQWLHLAVTGVLIHGGYLGGVWAAVKLGIGAGTIALLVGLQPVLTAIWISASARGSAKGQVTSRQWLGLALGLGGLALVVSGKLGAGEITPSNLALAVFALMSITVGTLYQKRFVHPCDARTAITVQLVAAWLVTLPFALLETEAVVWNASLIGALAWSVIGLTLGGSSLLYLLIQRGAATAVTSLLYLVPPVTALLAWLIFREALTLPMMLGMALTATGVALVVGAPAR